MDELIKIDANKLEKINKAFDAVCQPKTNFQIERFVVGQHDTPERQYMQCVIQIHTLVINIKRSEINRRRTLLKIEKLTKKKGELAELDLAEEKLNLEQIEFGLKGSLREFACYYAVLESFGKGFTYEEIQRAEIKYWPLRLARQAQCGVDAHSGPGSGNIEAMWQAGMTENPGKRFLESNAKLLKGLNHAKNDS